jgi:hypothetical protein
MRGLTKLSMSLLWVRTLTRVLVYLICVRVIAIIPSHVPSKFSCIKWTRGMDSKVGTGLRRM